jgi:hypothetical protein
MDKLDSNIDGASRSIAIIVVSSIFILIIWNCTLANDPYRTPSGIRAISYAPMAWYTGDYSIYLECTADSQGYDFWPYVEQINPHTQPPNVQLIHLLLEILEGNIGILRIITDGSEELFGAFMVEIYGWTESGRNLRDDAYVAYLLHPDFQFTDEHLITEDRESEELNCYAITLTAAGIRHITNVLYPDTLEGAIIFQSYCDASDFNDGWNALSVLGWDGKVIGLNNEHIFWQRMNGTRDRVGNRYLFSIFGIRFVNLGKTNKHRSVKHARSGVGQWNSQHGQSWYAGLQYSRMGKVVLSPIVLDHRPKPLKTMASSGWVEFDCEMDTSVEAEDIVLLTGVGYYGPELGGVRWAFNNNRKIEFSIPELEGFCWADFLVYADNAQSLHNHSLLDGSTNPPYLNGVGPNGDCYNWTSKVINYPIINFERRESRWDRRPIGDNIPELVFPDTFATGHPEVPFSWRFGKTTEQTNIYPYGNYPKYWVDGKWAAWIGDYDPSHYWIIYAPIRFIGTACALCVGYSTGQYTSFRAFNISGETIRNFSVSPNLAREGYPRTHGLGQAWIQADQYHPGQNISYITIRATQNTFGIDNLMIHDVLYGGLSIFPESYDISLGKIGKAEPGGDAVKYPIEVLEIVDSLYIMVNWDEEELIEIRLDIEDPQGQIVYEEQTGEPPIIVDPVIYDPLEGQWEAKVSVYQPPPTYESFAFAIIAGARYEPLIDCYIESGDNIKWYPSSPEMGDMVEIYAPIHAGVQFDSTVYCMPVRCYRGDPASGVQIDEDEFVLDLDPGATDTVYFNFDTEACEGVDPCMVYIVIDPDEELEEYDEGNNIACREITFGP